MRKLTETDVATFVRDELLSPARKVPLVAVTSHPGTDKSWVDPADLQKALGDLAEVVFIPTGEPTWALREALPERLDVYGGALRTWWPGFSPTADPYEHRLWFIHSQAEAQRVFEQVVAAVRQRAGLPAAEARPRAAAGGGGAATAPVRTGPGGETVLRRVATPADPETVRVTAAGNSRIEVASTQRRGLIHEADLPLSLLADCAVEGMELQARPLRPVGDGTWAFSVQGLLPDAWQRFADDVRIGDVVTGRVQNVDPRKRLVFVDVMPGVVGVCHQNELDWGRVDDAAAFAKPGELLPFEIVTMDREDLSLFLSRKRAYGQKPRALPPLIAGGKPFVWKSGMPLFENLRHVRRRAAAAAAEGGAGADMRPRIISYRAPIVGRDGGGEAAERADALAAELSAANEERASLVAQIRNLRQREQELRKDARAAEDRHDALQKRLSGDLDPLASERAFLQAVRVWYARQFDEDDRVRQPLQRMRVGPKFLASVRDMDGLETDKVVEVCGLVAADLAHTVAGREVHPLRDGGAGQRLRPRDGAMAWRCALQIKSPSARRLHWWRVPSQQGATIEFASIVLHDDFGIPE